MFPCPFIPCIAAARRAMFTGYFVSFVVSTGLKTAYQGSQFAQPLLLQSEGLVQQLELELEQRGQVLKSLARMPSDLAVARSGLAEGHLELERVSLDLVMAHLDLAVVVLLTHWDLVRANLGLVVELPAHWDLAELSSRSGLAERLAPV